MTLLRQSWNKPGKIILGILIGLIVFPTLTLGGTFVSSLIQGKGVPEALQILADQIDVLIGRVDVLENKQTELEGEQTRIIKEAECSRMEMLSIRVVAGRERTIEYAIDYYNQYPPTAEGVFEETQNQYERYLDAKAKCESAE